MRRFGMLRTTVLGLSAWVTAIPAQSTFVGKVTDAAGRPIPDVSLWLGDGAQRTQTAPDGTFHVDVPQSGTYRVRLQRYGYQAIEARVAVAPGAPGALFNLTRLNMPTRGDGRGAVRERQKPELELDAAKLAELPDFSIAGFLARVVGYADRGNEVFGRPVLMCSTYLDDACVYDDVRAPIAPGDLQRLRIVSRAGSGWTVLLTSKRGLDTPRDPS